MALFQCDVSVIQKSTAFAIPGSPSYQEVSYHRLVSLTSLLPRACRSMKLLASRNAIQSRTPNLIKLSIQSSTPKLFRYSSLCLRHSNIRVLRVRVFCLIVTFALYVIAIPTPYQSPTAGMHGIAESLYQTSFFSATLSSWLPQVPQACDDVT
jgi:hypothetical protein